MIKIYTLAHKRPDFIELQLKSFEKQLKDKFEFIIFNNAVFDNNKSQYLEIHKICKKNNLKCIDIQKKYNIIKNRNIFDKNGYINASLACAYPLCYAWEEVISKTNDLTCIIDSDMFLIDSFNISDILNEYDLVFLPQSRGLLGEVYYMWNGLVFLNLSKLPDKEKINWWCGHVEGYNVDVGGQTFYYLKKYKNQIKIGHLKQKHITEDISCDFNPPNYEYLSFDDSEVIFHYRGGSFWDGKSMDYHNKKTIWLKKLLDK